MHIDFTLPFQNPVLVFSIILFIILFAPILLSKLKIPAVIGLIVAGIIVGPNGFNILMRNSSVELFGTVGLLYIMFLAGLEIDLNEFKKNKYKSITFGFLTFSIPMLIGTVVFHDFLNYSMVSSVLIASMFASHTLVTYPMVSKLGISKNPAVNITVGGTMITDTAALLVLAVIAGSATGQLDNAFWIRLTVSVIVFAAIVIFLFPIVSRWFFKRNSDNIAQYIFVLALVFLASFLAMVAGIEAIIGAFLAGLALNRLIPRTSPLMNRIEFVGNALFIPFFLIGVGMLIDYRVLFGSYNALLVALIMTVIATVAKYLAAVSTQKIFRLSKDQGLMIFGLSNSQAAATLAAVLIGYNIILGETPDGEKIRLLSEDILNGTIIMILVTCTIASFATQKSGIGIAKADLNSEMAANQPVTQNTLIGLSNEATVESLVQLAVTMIDKKKNNELFGLNVITNEKENAETVNKASKLSELGQKFASSVDFKLQPLVRYDMNIVSGMKNTIKEKSIKHFYIGLHEKTSLIDHFFGNLTKDLLAKSDCTLYIYKSKHPLSTIRKFVVVIPANAELESGFSEWYSRVMQMARNTGNLFEIFAPMQTNDYLRKLKPDANVMFRNFEDFDDFLIISREIDEDTMLLVNLTRRDGVSYTPAMERIPEYLQKYFRENSFMLIYANRSGNSENEQNLYQDASLQENIINLKEKAETIFRRKD
jgi:Kef-type K+ transport system membrane component KefB